MDDGELDVKSVGDRGDPLRATRIRTKTFNTYKEKLILMKNSSYKFNESKSKKTIDFFKVIIHIISFQIFNIHI